MQATNGEVVQNCKDVFSDQFLSSIFFQIFSAPHRLLLVIRNDLLNFSNISSHKYLHI